MNFTAWYLIVGGILIAMALGGTLLKRLPLSPAMFYLIVGAALGPYGAGMILLDPIRDASLLERISEIAVIVSLFVAGLKLRTPLRHPAWKLPVLLAFASMTLTVGLIALAGVSLLGLPLGAAVLLGAILAPTDPVLASEVQVADTADRNRLRFSLTGEAGLNDGTAFPFVMLGLGLLGLHDLGEFGWRWFAIDVIWAVFGGLGIGWLAGWLVGRLVLYLRRQHREAIGLDNFLSLGLLALAYGGAIAAHAYGFLAAFAAGLALRYVEAAAAPTDEAPRDVRAGAAAEQDEEAAATDATTAPAYMARAVLGFNEQLERIVEVAMVLLLGGMLIQPGILRDLWFIPLLLLVIRPLAACGSVFAIRATLLERGLIGWFGIRGVGSIYYLAFALTHGLDEAIGRRLTAMTFIVVAASITLHGISVTPLMKVYERSRAGKGEAEVPDPSPAEPAG